MGETWTRSCFNRLRTTEDDEKRVVAEVAFVAQQCSHYLCGTVMVVCPNKGCGKRTINLHFCALISVLHQVAKYLLTRLPGSGAKPISDYIPVQILKNYCEACLVHSNSPKDSATLSHRCFQGIIRDLWKIEKNRLIGESDKLQIIQLTQALLNDFYFNQYERQQILQVLGKLAEEKKQHKSQPKVGQSSSKPRQASLQTNLKPDILQPHETLQFNPTCS